MPRPATVAETIGAVAHLPGGRTRFVGIDGPGGAGKSSLAGWIAEAVNSVDVVHVDDFAGPHVQEWDWDRMREQLLLPLLAGRRARYQRWDWDRDVGGEWVEVEPDRTVVIEGVSSTRRETGVPWDLTIWVETPADVRRARALARDGEQMWPVWEQQWIPTEQAYLAREQPQDRVDLIVDGTATCHRRGWHVNRRRSGTMDGP